MYSKPPSAALATQCGRGLGQRGAGRDEPVFERPVRAEAAADGDDAVGPNRVQLQDGELLSRGQPAVCPAPVATRRVTDDEPARSRVSPERRDEWLVTVLRVGVVLIHLAAGLAAGA